jgi:hypothetical protein
MIVCRELDSSWIATPCMRVRIPPRFPIICTFADIGQLAESVDLKSIQCEFESHYPHQKKEYDE